MDVFDQVKQAVDDFNLYWNGFSATEQEVKDITAAVEERIMRDKAAHTELVKTLTAQSEDPARPEILRKLAGKELERIQGCTFGPSEDETAAFNAAMSEAHAALREVGKTATKLQELLDTAKKGLQAIKNSTYQKYDPTLSRSSLERRRADFKSLSEPIEPVADRLERMRKGEYGQISDGLHYEHP